MVLLPGRALECDPVRPRYIRCDGLQKLLALPCMQVKSKISSYDQPDINIEWRKAMKLASALALKVVWGLKHYANTWYNMTVYAQFNWKRRTQYHYAKYVFMDTPITPNIERCLYLFKAPFRWGRYLGLAIDPITTYPLFRDMALLEDGTPDVPFFKNLSEWSEPPDPQLYSASEWHLVTDWEEVVFTYNHNYTRCISWANHKDKIVTETTTGRTGVIKDILNPQRQSEWWDSTRRWTKYTVKRSQWMKILPLEYLIEVPDGRTFITTRKNLTGL